MDIFFKKFYKKLNGYFFYKKLNEYFFQKNNIIKLYCLQLNYLENFFFLLIFLIRTYFIYFHNKNFIPFQQIVD